MKNGKLGLKHAARTALDSITASPPPPDLAGIKSELEIVVGLLEGISKIDTTAGVVRNSLEQLAISVRIIIALIDAGGKKSANESETGPELPSLSALGELAREQIFGGHSTQSNAAQALFICDWLSQHVARLEAQIEAMKTGKK